MPCGHYVLTISTVCGGSTELGDSVSSPGPNLLESSRDISDVTFSSHTLNTISIFLLEILIVLFPTMLCN